MVETSDEWITKRTGISERRILENNESVYTLGVEAAKRALADANLSASDIGLIIVSTSTPDYLTPSTSCLIQGGIGAVNAAAFDLNAACSGFIYSITVARQLIISGCYQKILVVACEGLSKVTEWSDRNSCVLFGDGAGAFVLGQVEEGYGIISTYLGADGSMGDRVTIPCLRVAEDDLQVRRDFKNKKAFWQDGQEIFKFAVKIMPAAAEKVLENTGITLDEIKYIIPHQANIRIIESAVKRLGIGMDKVYTAIKKYGNISSASVPVALDDAYKKNCVKRGDLFLLVGFGGGLTWASALVRWSKDTEYGKSVTGNT